MSRTAIALNLARPPLVLPAGRDASAISVLLRCALLALAAYCSPCFSVEAKKPAHTYETSTEIVAKGCPAVQDLEKGGYTIGSVRLESPFRHLPWLSAAMDAAEQAVKKLEGRPYVAGEVRQKRNEVRELNFPPGSGDQRVRVLIVVTKLDGCDGKKVHIVYSVYSSQILPSFANSIEAANAPADKVAGATDVTGRVRFTPRLDYDRSRKAMAGGRLEYALEPEATEGLIGNMVADVSNSSTSHDRSFALSGAKEHTGVGPLAHSEWQLGYQDQMLPSEQTQLSKRRLAAQWLAVTKPLGKWKLPLRFGASVENGRLDSDFTQAQLPVNTVRGGDYNSVKLHVGTTAQLSRSAFSASYGVEGGALGSTARPGWVKHVVDLAHEITIPTNTTDADGKTTKNRRRAVEIESRFTAGLIQVKTEVPASARFFGGNREDAFIAGDSWSMRSNPFIRSIAAGKFGREAGAAGGTRFSAINLTISYPVQYTPLVPEEVARTGEAQGAINGGLTTAENTITARTLDQDNRRAPAIAALLSGLRAGFASLRKDVDSARAAGSDVDADLFDACTTAIGEANDSVDGATSTKDSDELKGYLDALLPYKAASGEIQLGQVNGVLTACIANLNARVGSTAIAQDAKPLRDSLTGSQYVLIKEEAKSKAAEEMNPIRKIVDKLFNEVNLAAISPVLMLDAARMSPNGGLGTRYGVGLGLRATLVNSVDFTLGYVANPRRAAGESSGEAFFTMRIRDLF